MYAVLGEDDTDAETIKAIVANLVGARVKIHSKGFGGKDKLLKRLPASIDLLRGLGFNKFVICHDSDSDDPKESYAKVASRIAGKFKNPDACRIIIPVYMIEAWILADMAAISKVVTSWKSKQIANPEKIVNPKRELEKLGKKQRGRPCYDHTTHNQQVAKHLDPEIVARKCPSFRPLIEFIRQSG